MVNACAGLEGLLPARAQDGAVAPTITNDNDSEEEWDEDQLVMATDDLIDALIFTIVQGYLLLCHSRAASLIGLMAAFFFVCHRYPHTSSLLTDLRYVHSFHFSSLSTSVLGFVLSNFDVAIEWLLNHLGRSGTVQDLFFATRQQDGDRGHTDASPSADLRASTLEQPEGPMSAGSELNDLGDGGLREGGKEGRREGRREGGREKSLHSDKEKGTHTGDRGRISHPPWVWDTLRQEVCALGAQLSRGVYPRRAVGCSSSHFATLPPSSRRPLTRQGLDRKRVHTDDLSRVTTCQQKVD